MMYMYYKLCTVNFLPDLVDALHAALYAATLVQDPKMARTLDQRKKRVVTCCLICHYDILCLSLSLDVSCKSLQYSE